MPASLPGPHYFYLGIEFWAESGAIFAVDTQLAETDESKATKQVPARTFLKRAVAACMSVPEDVWPSEGMAARKMLEEAKEAVKLAVHQGDETDPKVRDHISKHVHQAQIIVPGGPTTATGKSLAGISYRFVPGSSPRDIFTGKESINVVPDLEVPVGTKIHPSMFNNLGRRFQT